MNIFRRYDPSKDSAHQDAPIELQENGQPAVANIPPRRPSQLRTFMTRFANSGLLPKVRLPISFLVGAGITGVTTWALVKNVQHLLASASVDSKPETWLQKARKDYDHCYNGCSECRDLDFAFNACQKTSQVGRSCKSLFLPGTC